MAFPLLDVLDIGTKLIDRLIPDKEKAAEMKLKLVELDQAGDLATMAQQSEVNKAEAANTNMFIAGWRPFVGWVCGGGLGYALIVGPMIEGLSVVFGHPVKLPILDVSLLTTMLIGMLGLGGMRTMEKLQGVEGNR